MRWRDTARLRLRSLFRGDRVDDELDRELRFHVEQQIEENRAAGMSDDEARHAAHRAFGRMTQIQERCRDERGMNLPRDGYRDAVYALRSFARTPVFSVTAVLTLALGIGATTAVFSIVRGVLLRPLPYPDADRLVRIVEHVPAGQSITGEPMRMASMNLEEFTWWREETRTLSHMAVIMPETRTMLAPQGAERLAGARVSPALFPLRGIPPVLGRWLRADEERPGANVVLLGEATWRRHFSARADIVGGAVVLDGQVHTIVGVMPAAFGPEAFWAPFTIQSRPGAVTFIAVISRLADGVSLEEAIVEANALGHRLRGIEPPSPLDEPRSPRFEVVRELDAAVAAVRPALQLLVAAVGALLLIVCANVANLLLTRGAGRAREISVRRALGATRARVIRQLIAESAVLSCAGGLAGAALAFATVRFAREWGVIDVPDRFRSALGQFGPAVLPRLEQVSVDPWALGFAAGISIGTGLLFGLAPAIRLSRIDPASRGAGNLRVHPRTSGGGELLAAVQLALATALLIGAGLLVHSFGRLSSLPLGFDPDVQVFQLVIPGEYSPARRVSVAHEVVARLRGTPGVQAAGFTSEMPFEGSLFDPDETLVPTDWTGNSEDLQREDRSDTRMVSPDYLRALGVRLVEGRWLADRDDAAAPRALLVNRAWVRRFSPDRNAVGRLVNSVVPSRRPGAATFPWRIVGVVEDVRMRIGDGPGGTGDLTVYMDLRQWLGRNAPAVVNRPGQPNLEIQMAFGFSNGLAYVVRRDGPPFTMDDLRGVVGGVDRALAVEGQTTMGDVFAGVIGRQRFHALTVVLFGAIAAIVAAVGTYGVLACATGQRTREFGLRLALGGTPHAVLALVMRRGILVAVAGVSAGIVLAAGAMRSLSGLLFGVTPFDPATYAVVAAGCLVVAAFASYVPARRATRVDPVVALRLE